MDIKMQNTDQLIPYINNPRNNDSAVDAVASSIKNFGFKVPIVVDKDNEIIAGHTRLLAAKKLGYEEVPTIVAEDLDENQVRAFRLADNKVSELAEWDIDLLENELTAIDDIDMESFGFDELLNELDDEDEDDEYQDGHDVEEDDFDLGEYGDDYQPQSKRGEVYQLGKHVLMCGDGTDEEDVGKLMHGVKADLVFTDQPYGMKKENEGVTNDNLNYSDLLDFNAKWIPLSFDYLTDIGSWYCWGIDEPLMDIYSHILKPMIKDDEISFRNLITWDKGYGHGMSSSKQRSYATADEKCLFVMKGVEEFNNNQDNYFEGYEPIRTYLVDEAERVGLTSTKSKEITGTGMYSHWFTKSQWILITEENYRKIQNYYNGDGFTKEYKEIKMEHDKVKQSFYDSRSYFNNVHDNMNNVWDFPRTSQAERVDTGGHATPKPLELCARGIKSSSREGDVVLDLFGGSGSTLIACEQLNRSCRMMEFEPMYVDVIINRWEKMTGEKAQLIQAVV